MSKKKSKKAQPLDQPAAVETMSPIGFGYEEMLSELEAIVEDAQTRLQDEDNAA
ncbi:TPA: hypothetical protein OTX98_002366 [Klebsiella aerogenes]|nr:hypothetical protein [Klebsiella aerogenes]